MTMPPAIEALRTRVAWSRAEGTAVVAVRGEDARAALLHLLPSRLLLRDAQVKESLILTEEGRPVADVLVCADDEDYFLLVEGMSAEEVLEHARAHLPAGLAVELADLTPGYDVVRVDGPWAWELVSLVLGPDLVALPYLNYFRIDQGWCVRAGKTGEYGYELVARRETTGALLASLAEHGAAMGLAEIDEEALALSRFESWFFDPRYVPEDVTPVELQLQWRLDPTRSWVGSAAVEVRRASATRRLTCVVTAKEIEAGDEVRFGARVIGRVARAAYSHAREEWIASALLDREYAHGGIDRYEVRGARVRTTAPPLIDNRSLYVDPRRHSFQTADEIAFGPLWRGARAPGAGA